MYKFPYFTEHDKGEVLSFMHAHEFITLIGCADGHSVATQVPVLIEERDGLLYLKGHIMRKTDHCNAFEKNNEALVLFQGAHCYVSSSWYTEKMGATWNYQTVHARGTMKFLSDEETMGILTALTAKYEAVQPQPLFAAQLPAGYMQQHVKAIAGFEIAVNDIYPIFKLSQNRDDKSYKNIVAHLQMGDSPGEAAVAQEMISRRPQLFA